jgi:putative photosynthetic complex assembly protein
MESTSSRNLDRSARSDGLPRGALFAAIGLVVMTLVLVFADQALDAWRGEDSVTAPQRVHQIWFEDRTDGDVAIRGGQDDAPLIVLPGESNSFVKSVVRSLVHIREREGLDLTAPFQLVVWTDGTKILADPTTGQYMPLNGFGRDNEAGFTAMLAALSDQS